MAEQRTTAGKAAPVDKPNAYLKRRMRRDAHKRVATLVDDIVTLDGDTEFGGLITELREALNA